MSQHGKQSNSKTNIKKGLEPKLGPFSYYFLPKLRDENLSENTFINIYTISIRDLETN
jgi:hypothetical protein